VPKEPMINIDEIKKNMETIASKWKGTVPDPNPKSSDHILRTIDRMKYRALQRDYVRVTNLNGQPQDIVAIAEELFGVRAE
jgi:hypothetical protein